MAAAMFELLTDPAKAVGISAGTQPGERVHPEVVEAMRELGMDLSGRKPQVTMGGGGARTQASPSWGSVAG